MATARLRATPAPAALHARAASHHGLAALAPDHPTRAAASSVARMALAAAFGVLAVALLFAAY